MTASESQQIEQAETQRTTLVSRYPDIAFGRDKPDAKPEPKRGKPKPKPKPKAEAEPKKRDTYWPSRDDRLPARRHSERGIYAVKGIQSLTSGGLPNSNRRRH
ncbi:hypothetical protein [Gordonia sp. FQ]|uniref:hypothetical protein n=1 Tax=Gordonia sp. FQ TaxID=3446634 RepID=UPI003F845465